MVIVVAGPTAVGKTKLSVELAKLLNGEVINADSTQIYKGMNIATAKITEEEKEGVVHHLFDVCDYTEEYSVYDYQKDARKIINQILAQGKTPILVGGTGLYIKAALYDYQFNEEPPRNDYSSFSNEEVYQRLLELDPNTQIHKNNRKRVERALDYCLCHKSPFSEKEVTNKLLYDTSFVGLTTDRKILYERINKRVDLMIESGLLKEAQMIFESGIRNKAVLTPIGYKELFPYFEETAHLENCLNQIRQNSRKYAKRQYTWFNNQLPVSWYEVDFDNFKKTIELVFNDIKKDII